MYARLPEQQTQVPDFLNSKLRCPRIEINPIPSSLDPNSSSHPPLQRSRVLHVRRLTAYFEMCLSARRRIGSTVSRLRVYSIVFPSLWLVTSPQNARHLRL